MSGVNYFSQRVAAGRSNCRRSLSLVGLPFGGDADRFGRHQRAIAPQGPEDFLIVDDRDFARPAVSIAGAADLIAGDAGLRGAGFALASRSGYSWHRYAPPHCSPRISTRSRNPGTGSAAPGKAKELKTKTPVSRCINKPLQPVNPRPPLLSFSQSSKLLKKWVCLSSFDSIVRLCWWRWRRLSWLSFASERHFRLRFWPFVISSMFCNGR